MFFDYCDQDLAQCRTAFFSLIITYDCLLIHTRAPQSRSTSYNMDAVSLTAHSNKATNIMDQSEISVVPDEVPPQDLNKRNENDEACCIESQFKQARSFVSSLQQDLRLNEQAMNLSRQIMMRYAVVSTEKGRAVIEESLQTMLQLNRACTHEMTKTFRSTLKNVAYLEDQLEQHEASKVSKLRTKALSRRALKREKKMVKKRIDAILGLRAEIKEQDKRIKAISKRRNRQISCRLVEERDAYKTKLAQYTAARRFHNQEMRRSEHLLIMNGGDGIQKMCYQCLHNARNPLHRPGSCTDAVEACFSRPSPLRNEVLMESIESDARGGAWDL